MIKSYPVTKGAICFIKTRISGEKIKNAFIQAFILLHVHGIGFSHMTQYS